MVTPNFSVNFEPIVKIYFRTVPLGIFYSFALYPHLVSFLEGTSMTPYLILIVLALYYIGQPHSD